MHPAALSTIAEHLVYYVIDCIEYSYANLLFFASMISDLFCAFGKQKDLQSRVKGQLPKRRSIC